MYECVFGRERRQIGDEAAINGIFLFKQFKEFYWINRRGEEKTVAGGKFVAQPKMAFHFVCMKLNDYL